MMRMDKLSDSKGKTDKQRRRLGWRGRKLMRSALKELNMEISERMFSRRVNT